MIMNNQDGGTPLYVAAAGGHRDIVQLLLNKGAMLEHLRDDTHIQVNRRWLTKAPSI